MSTTMSLPRNCSMRNSWATNSHVTGLGGPQPPAVPLHRKPIDTISMNSRIQQFAGNNNSIKFHAQERNKYNTLTPAEAKKLTKYLNGKQPTRTASVLHKPRAPPDLANPSQHYSGPNYRYAQNSLNNDVQDSNKLSDESYSSAKSQQSGTFNLRSASKASLSSSTSRVFQNQLTNLKKFLRYMPIKRSFMNNETDHKVIETDNSDKRDLAESISQICLNRSQSPPVCPPPPRELKSMSYMESAVNYSNYDEFTRNRNRQTSNMLTGYSRGNNRDNRHEDSSVPLNSSNDTDSWQLTSLPVSYERNLTTVFEERQNSTDLPKSLSQNLIRNEQFVNKDEHFIKPPPNFDDKSYENGTTDTNSASNTNSSQSFTSITTADSVLDYHRQTASSFRFSYAQPNASEITAYPRNAGLPPKMPSYDTRPGYLGNSPLNGSSAHPSINETNSLGKDVVDYRENSGFENDLDTTILSDTSTLHEDNTIFMNKCAELERTVESLKNKLIGKEKELTDLQLKQWSSDYLIDQLKSTISRLEKENSQLRTVVAHRVNL